MTHGENRRPRTRRKRPGSATKNPPISPGQNVELALARAQAEQNPRLALEIFQALLVACHDGSTASVFAGEGLALWDQADARPYLESLFGVASSLRRLDRREEAVGRLRELLALEPRDHQSARYWLAACLFDLGRHDELKQLLEGYEELTAVWRYAQALLAFRLGGDNDEARQILQDAYRLDAGFLEYLLGDGLVHADRPIRFDRDREEAMHSCAALFLLAWRSTSGAAAWVRRVLRVPFASAPAELSFPRRELLGLPRRNVAWQLGVRLVDDDASSSARVWVLAIADIDEQKLLYMTVLEQEPTPESVWPEVVSAFRSPLEGRPHRPARLEVPRDDFCRAWQAMLAQVAVQCVRVDGPQPIDQLLAGLAVAAHAQRLPALAADVDSRDFPQTDEVWQADFFHMPTMISNEEVGVERPWAVVVVDRRSEFVLSNELFHGEPTAEVMWEYVVRTMAHPGPREPLRPSLVEVSDSDCYDFLKPQLAELGVGCVLRDELPELDAFCRTLAGSLGGPDKCALVDGRGVTREQMESFYHAAASYFERAPWRHVPGEIPIEIRCRGLAAGTRYAIVLGRTGVTLGLAIFDTRDDVVAMLHGLKSWEDLSGFSVIFDEMAVMAPADLHLVERNGWPIATPEAYPVALRLEPGRPPQSPTSADLDYLESCLRIIPDFVTRHEDAKTYELATNGKRFKMRLYWTFRDP